MQKRLHQYAQLAAVAAVVVGCYLVLHPLIPAILFAGVVCLATWPIYLWLRKVLWGKPWLGAFAMTVLLVLLVIGPTVLLAVNLGDSAAAMVEQGSALLKGAPIEPPDWVRALPLAGELLADYWQRLASGADSLAMQWKGLLEPARRFAVGAGKMAGEGLLHMTLATFICYFFYRDGEALVLGARRVLERLAGNLGAGLLDTIGNAVTGVVHGVFGTALAQALVALAGFLIAGVPAPLLFAAATFAASIIPFGPPLVWGTAAAWLAFDGQIGWAAFMALWGLLVISTIDNVVKPYLISRSSRLPILLVVLGVLGGLIAFGFIGLFIGPPALAVGLTLIRFWIARPDRAAPG